MLVLTKISATTWLVQYNNNVFRVRDTFIANMASRKNAMMRIRHIIAKATKKNADRFRHVENRVNHGHWSQYWIEV